MDLLSLAVDEMRLLRAEYEALALPAGAAHSFAAGSVRLHVIEAGQVSVHTEGAPLTATGGDLLLFPRGTGHALQAIETEAVLVSGRLAFEAVDHPLFGVLPAVVHATPSLIAKSPHFAEHMRHLVNEIRRAQDGTDVLLARLTDVLFIEVMRFFTPPPGVECPVGGFFSALNDALVRKVLVAIHQDPGAPWTVASLAEVAGESRSAFAAHFASVMKEPPMAYLSRWRMFRARGLLRQTDLGLSQIAEQLGYGSAAAFSLAFTREHGIAPGAYRTEPKLTVPGSPAVR